MKDLKKDEADKRPSNTRAFIIFGAFILMFVLLVIYEVSTKK